MEYSVPKISQKGIFFFMCDFIIQHICSAPDKNYTNGFTAAG